MQEIQLISVFSFLSTIGSSISANCNNKIKDELVTFEPNFYPGNRIEPTVHPRKGYLAILPDTWNKTEEPTVTKNEVWSVEFVGIEEAYVSQV